MATENSTQLPSFTDRERVLLHMLVCYTTSNIGDLVDAYADLDSDGCPNHDRICVHGTHGLYFGPAVQENEIWDLSNKLDVLIARKESRNG
jgi:hypothetical protein